MVSVILGLLMLVVLIVMIVIGAILIGMFFTGLVGGIILLVTGNKLTQNVKRKLAGRICIGVGVVLLILAAGSASVIINYVMQLM